jgi:quercetin dioxygenase-like cupin family protein
MRVYKSKKWKGGWFIGNFKPAAYHTNEFEVCHKIHAKGERWPKHYHKVATEINYMISGKMTIRGRTLTAGDIFILRPGEIADPKFLTACQLIVVKVPSVKNDKFEIQ